MKRANANSALALCITGNLIHNTKTQLPHTLQHHRLSTSRPQLLSYTQTNQNSPPTTRRRLESNNLTDDAKKMIRDANAKRTNPIKINL